MKKLHVDSTASHLGNIFQYVVALECCLNIDSTESVFIEKYGDVTTPHAQIETKHHRSKKQILTNKHIDFWKTLNNWVITRNSIKDHKHLILLTTSTLKKDSDFSSWNNSTADEKSQILKKLLKGNSASIQEYVKTIYNFNSKYTHKDFLDLLSKIKIQYDSKQATAKIKELEKLKNFDAFPRQNRKHFINSLLGYLMRKATETPLNWEINGSDFQNYFQRNSSLYVSDKIPIPDTYKSTTVDSKSYKKEKFVSEIAIIDASEEIPDAIQNYYRASRTFIDFCSDDKLFVDDVDEYKKGLSTNLKLTKGLVIEECQKPELSERKRHSRILYKKVMLWEAEDFGRISPNQQFFQRGIIHHIVNEDEFNWLIKK